MDICNLYCIFIAKTAISALTAPSGSSCRHPCLHSWPQVAPLAYASACTHGPKWLLLPAPLPTLTAPSGRETEQDISDCGKPSEEARSRVQKQGCRSWDAEAGMQKKGCRSRGADGGDILFCASATWGRWGWQGKKSGPMGLSRQKKSGADGACKAGLQVSAGGRRCRRGCRRRDPWRRA